jgi:lambda repressor-like predicted transcriptional regulator
MKLNNLAIKKLLAEKRMTMTELSKLTGLNKSMVSLILRRGTCSIKNGGLIADALGVEIEEIWKEE